MNNIKQIIITIAFLLLADFVFSQSQPVVFKATSVKVQLSPESDFSTLSSDDLFIINIDQKEITIISEACKVYRITEVTNKVSDGLKYVEFKVVDRNNRQTIFDSFIDEHETISDYKILTINDSKHISIFTVALVKTF